MNLEVFDLTPVLLNGVPDHSLCMRLAKCLHETSCLVVRDPRVTVQDNEAFLDLMERYFEQPVAVKLREARPELHYQVGLTPEGIEIPEAVHDPNAMTKLRQLGALDQPRMPKGPDPKCRYMWRIGPRPGNTAYYELNAEPVIPEGFPEWQGVMDNWGQKLLDTLYTVSDLLSEGLGWEDTSTLRRLMHHGPHLLAPTGVDLALYKQLDTCLAGYHADLNLFTIHGKARFHGLHIWLRNGKRISVQLPDGCLLIQAGSQLERLTGGYIQAGMHEVVVSEATLNAVQAAEAVGKCTWRVSSTLFGHVASDAELVPLGLFKTEAALKAYPSVVAGDFVADVLNRISLY